MSMFSIYAIGNVFQLFSTFKLFMRQLDNLWSL